ncbi:baseplate J/gp47 family protein, partial [Escherichia coli]|nr:baseplate J/gp47 family protein [Escherichia coli]
GTTIPAGSTAVDTSGYIYQSIDNAIIPSSGSVDVQFVNTTTGPIPCASGSLNQIYRAVSGWDAVNNISPGVVGVDVESRIAFETRRRQSVARNSRNQDASTLAALLATDGVLDAYVWSNRTAATVNQGATNFPVVAHSIYICVYGGTDEDVAESIFQTYNPGANLNGDTSYTVYDNVNYLPPYPSYVMQWQKATPTRVYFSVELDRSLNPPSDITSQVKSMIVSVFNGGYDGIGKARIGSTINASKYYAPVISISPDTVGILSLEVSIDGSAYGPAITMGIDQVPTIQESDITVILS